VQLSAGMHLIKAEVAASDPARARGLMFREYLPPNGGMIFLFDEKARQCMWRQHPDPAVGRLPGRRRQHHRHRHGAAHRLSHCSSAPARYALEMTALVAKGIEPGMKIGGLPAAR
jgi:uncharacterized membrane protein (UPF0127 family)